MSSRPISHVRVAIIGSGFAGLGAAIRLKQRGVTDFVVLERGNDLGGVWRDNTYPGCACDVQSHLYEFSFAPNTDWSRAYSPQKEIHEYLRACAVRFGVLDHISFGHEVLAATWEDEPRRWHLRTSQGALAADVLVAATGGLSDPRVPPIPGLALFDGPTFHSARWNHEVDLANKRIAVIGTGASAIQFVPAIQPRVKRLHIFQRSPPWVLPRSDRLISARAKQIYGSVPFAQKAVRSAIGLTRELLLLTFRYRALGALVERLALRYLRKTISDPVLRAKVTPTYRIGCKRIVLSNDYLPSLSSANVEVVTDTIREVRRRSIVTADGVERDVDAIICGTGFFVTDQPVANLVRGREGRTLADAWQGSPKAHLGTMVAGFPNLFLLQGPNTGLGHTSVVLMMEAQIEFILRALRHIDREQVAAIEPLPEAQAAYVARVQADMRGSTWTTGGCASWYIDATGRNSTLWPGFAWTFRRRLARLNPSEFITTPRAADRSDATSPGPILPPRWRAGRAHDSGATLPGELS